MTDGHDFDAIWRDAGPGLWRAVLVYAGGRRDVTDDAVAEAFARAMEHDAVIRDPVAYLYRVAFRLAAKDLKRDRRHGSLPEGVVVDALDSDRAADVLAALRRLSPLQRAAVYLRYHGEMSTREIAAALGSTNAAVRVHLMRGRRRLADMLVDDEVEVPR